MLLGLLPVNGLLFSQIYIGSYIANLIAIPWVSFLVLPWILLGLLFIMLNIHFADNLMVVADYNLTGLLAILNKLIIFFPDNLNITTPSWPVFILSCVGAWILLSKIYFNKFLGIICLLPLIFNQQITPNYGSAKIAILDVGQGLGVVIQLQNHLVLYDAGPNNRVMANYLKNFNNKNIDHVIISHTDSDHIGGLEEVTKYKLVNKLSTSLSDADDAWQTSKQLAIGANQLLANSCIADHVWQLDGVEFEFLQIKKKKIHKNDSSCILKITTEQHSILLPGDITAKTEKLLVAKYGDKLKSDILIIPHHGSGTSSSEQFITAVSPKYAIVSAGYSNSYGHPKSEILARYISNNVGIFNTIEHGTISFNLSTIGKTIEYNCYRIAKSNFWNY
jgi:competence protein ComEC